MTWTDLGCHIVHGNADVFAQLWILFGDIIGDKVVQLAAKFHLQWSLISFISNWAVPR